MGNYFTAPREGEPGVEVYFQRESGTDHWGVIARYYTVFEVVAVPNSLVPLLMESQPNPNRLLEDHRFKPYKTNALRGLWQKLAGVFELLQPCIHQRFSAGEIDSASHVVTHVMTPLDLYDIGFDDVTIQPKDMKKIAAVLQQDGALNMMYRLALSSAARQIGIQPRVNLDAVGNKLMVGDRIRPEFDWTLDYLTEGEANSPIAYQLAKLANPTQLDPVLIGREQIGVIIETPEPEVVRVRFPNAVIEVSSEAVRYVGSERPDQQSGDAASD